MVNPGQAVSAASGSFKAWWKFFGVTLIVVVFTIIFLNAISESIKTQSFEPIVNEIGNRVVLASKNLQTESQLIIDRGGLGDFSGGFFSGMWDLLVRAANIFGAACLFWAWITILAKIFDASPYSLNTFSTWSLAFIAFYVLQVLFLLVFASLNGTVTGISTGDYSIGHIFYIPILSVITFVKALPFILSPLAKYAKQIEGVATS